MTWKPFVAVLAAAIATPAFAAAVMHAGGWETRNDDGPVNHVCESVDRAIDGPSLTKMLAAQGMSCEPPKVSSLGNVMTIDVACQVGGGRMAIHETVTQTGPDAFATKTHSHFEGATKFPDMDMSQVSHRVGACKPGDVKSPF